MKVPEKEFLIGPTGVDDNFWRDLWRYRQLFAFLTWRDILARYKQTTIGVAWCLVRPIIMMVIFTLVFTPDCGTFGGGHALPGPGFCGSIAVAIILRRCFRFQQLLAQQYTARDQGVYSPEKSTFRSYSDFVRLNPNPMLTHCERMQACLSSDPALDRVPVALWRHFPVDDQSPGTLPAATVDFQHRYGFDLVKVTPASSFSIKDWGAEDVWEGHTEGTRRYTHRVVKKPQDWERLTVLDPRKAKHLAAQLECLRLIRAAIGPETPILQTVFSPLAQAKNLAGGDTLIVHLRQYPEAVMKGLGTITETTAGLSKHPPRQASTGSSTQSSMRKPRCWPSMNIKSMVCPSTLQTLQPATSLWCNLLHLHGLNIHFHAA